MRKILTMLAVAAALVFGLSSCDLDFVDDYTFSWLDAPESEAA